MTFIKGICIGSGAYSSVYDNAGQGAIVYKECSITEHGRRIHIDNEISFLNKLTNCPYVIQVLNWDDCGIYFPKYACNLTNYINMNELIDRHEIIMLVYRIAMAIRYNRSAEIIHRDIKPDNILLNSVNDAVLADYGLASYENEECESTYIGTLHWRAPELLRAYLDDTNIQYDHKIDIWSLGMVALQLINGSSMLHTMDEAATYAAVVSQLPEWLDHIKITEDDLMHDMIKGMLQVDPSERFDVDQLLNHEIFGEIL